MLKKRSWKNLLSQADPEKDCLPAVQEDEEEWQAVGAPGVAPASWPWGDRPRITGRGALRWIEKIALAVESLVNRAVGADELNPFYHTGTISVFLLIVVAVTGLYLTVFYVAPGMGTGVAYEAVEAIDRHWLWIGRIMRGVHRYASGASVIAVLFHTLRTLFQDRFRGARWLAWFTGMLMLGALFLEGLSGYWLVWDTRAQLILDTVLKALNLFPSVGVPYALDFITNEATAQIWIFFLLLLFAHIALFTVLGLFYWFHVLRLSRAKFLPPRYFMIALGVLLVAAALFWPARSAPKADLGQLPGRLTIDPFYLIYLPATVRISPAFFWSAALISFGVATAVPWLLRGARQRQPGVVVIDKNTCTGCTNCANDCPYNAIVMAPRTDGKPHKLVAIENPNLCVGCGVCIGSCDGRAVSLTDLPVTPYYESILARVRGAAVRGPVKVVFTCERHGAHGAKGAASGEWQVAGGTPDTRHASPVTIVMPCVGVLHPNLAGQVIEVGAAEVLVVGCPADDCAQREGNLWIDARVNRTRPPRLRRNYMGAPIHTALLPPNEFAAALKRAAPTPVPAQKTPPAKNGQVRPTVKPAHWIRGGALLALVLAAQVFVTDLPYQPFRLDESLLQLGARNEGELRRNSEVLTGPELAQLPPDEQVKYLNAQQAEGRFPTRLRLEIDGRVVLDQTYRAQGFHQEGSAFVYDKFFLSPGEHEVRLSMDDAGGELQTVIDQTVNFAPGQIRTLTLNRVTGAFEVK
jgi:ferredoxin